MLKHFFENNTYTMRSGIASGLKRKGGLGFFPKIKQKEEHIFLKKINLQGKVVYDIGAFYGIFSLFFAKQAGPVGKVFAFEPNDESYRRALENARINSLYNLVFFPVALAEKTQKNDSFLFIPHHKSAMSFLDTQNSDDAREIDGARQRTVVYALDDFIKERSIPDPDFIKIDVEGGETNVLRGMQVLLSRVHPDLFIEIHGEGNQKALSYQGIGDFLRAYGYSMYSIEDKKGIEQASDFQGSHIFCTHTIHA